MRHSAALGVFFALIAATSQAQDPAATPAPTPEGRHSGAPIGQFTVGPFIVTPTFRIGTLAVDTNVQYQRERKADFVASGGPGLDIALPFLDHWNLGLQGASEYFYFHRTRELRRWTGSGAARLNWATTGTMASLAVTSGRDFSRPNFEVDTRILSTQNTVLGSLERDLGRLTLAVRSTLTRQRVDEGQEFRGADLASTLTMDRLTAAPEFRFRLTPLSSLILEGNYEASRFPKASARNFHGEGIGVGVLTTGLIKGRLTVGWRRSQLANRADTSTQPYFRLGITESRQIGRRLRFRGGYTHDSTVSAFAVAGALPTIEQRGIRVELEFEINKRMDLRVTATRTTLRSDGLVNVILDDGTRAVARRDDVAEVGAADLGFRLGRARIGLFASYTTRESLYFADFGVKGLQAGARVDYAPF